VDLPDLHHGEGGGNLVQGGRGDVADDGCFGVTTQGRLQDAGELAVPVRDVSTCKGEACLGILILGNFLHLHLVVTNKNVGNIVPDQPAWPLPPPPVPPPTLPLQPSLEKYKWLKPPCIVRDILSWK